MENTNTEYSDARLLGPFSTMLSELRQLSTNNLKAIFKIQKYVEGSAKTLSTFLTGGVDTLRHMQGIWFSSEEFVTTIGRAIFTTSWGKHIDGSEVIDKLTSLSPALYWQPTTELLC